MTPEQTELMEKLNCLELETSQLNHAYQLWRSYVEQGTAPDWMAAAVRITCDAVITLCIDTASVLTPETNHFGEIDRGPQIAPVLRGQGWLDCYARSGETAAPREHALLAEDSMTGLYVPYGQSLQYNGAENDLPVHFTALVDGSLALTLRQQNQIVDALTPEQTELMEKLTCLEFETSQLNHAYQLWRSYVEHGTAPDWMAAAIRITYDALITLCLDTVSVLAPETNHVGETTPVLRGQGWLDCYASSGEIAPPPEHALLAEDNMTALCLQPRQRCQDDGAESSPGVDVTALIEGSLVLTRGMQPNPTVGALVLADVPRAFSVRHLAQLEAACEISRIVEEESTTVESSELLPVTQPDWYKLEIPVDVSQLSTGDAISEQPAIQQAQREEEAMGELAAIRVPAILASWLQGSSTSRLFRAACVAILMVVGGAVGIYVMSLQRAEPRSDVQVRAAGAVAIPSGEKAEVKFDPDPVIARSGSSFVLNAVLSRGSDIASVAAQIDYDANLLQLVSVSEGGFLVKTGRQFVLAQRDDPLAGVLKVSAEQSPGNAGISGDGSVFALSFQARRKGKATVSIVPGAHDSQGRRIEMAGSQVSVNVR